MSATAIATRPYLGLRYFEERDAHLFYGRDEHVSELIGKVAQNRFVAVMGSSGSGKSSLVRAGLLPELRSGMIPKAGPRWKVVEFKPGRAPLVELAHAIRLELGVEHAEELVEEGPLGIARAVAEAKLDEGKNVLVIADQFEEVFRFQREESSQGRGTQAVEQCHALVRRLLDAAAQPELPIYVLLVMRSDYLGECAQFPELPERMSESLYLVPRLRRDQLQEAITAPVGGAIEPAVVQRLLAEVGSDPDQLPRLQHLLGRMWDRAGGGRLTMDHYTGSGGWETGLEQHLEEVYTRLSVPQQAVCRRMFQQLSELDKGRAVRRRAEIGELIEVCGSDAANVVGTFRAEGFVTPRENPVDITHECILREWPRLREWLEREDLNAKRLRELAEAARDASWRPGLTPEQQEPVRELAGLTLQNLTGWRDEARPTAAWARRYLTVVDFETADGYLPWSEKRDKEQKTRTRRRTRFLLGLVGLLLVGLALTSWKFYRQKLAAADLAAQVRVTGLPAYAAASQLDDPALALYLGWRVAKIERPLPLGLETVLATALTNGPSYAILRGHASEVTAVAWSPDGKIVASASNDQTIRLWDAVSGQSLRTLRGHEGPVLAVAWSSDGKFLASSSDDKTIRLWTADGQQVRVMSAGQRVPSIAWNPDGKTVAAAVTVIMGKSIQIWDIASGQLRTTLGDYQTVAAAVAWSPDGKTVVAGGDVLSGGRILLCDASGSQACQIDKDISGAAVTRVAWSPDGKTLAAASDDLKIRLWDPVSRKDLDTTPLQTQGKVYDVAWSPDGQTLAFAGDSKTIELWGADSRGVTRTLRGHRDRVTGVAWSPDGTLASASSDQTIRLWEVTSGQPLRTLQGHHDRVLSVAWNPDGRTLASASNDQTVRLWDAATQQHIRILQQDEPGVGRYGASGVAFSPDGKTLASARGGSIQLWNAATGQRIRIMPDRERGVYSVAWGPDGKTLASAGTLDGTVQLWDAASGQPLRTFQGNESQLNSVAWSPDGKTLASAGTDPTVQLWDVASGQRPRTNEGDQPEGYSVAWSPDGNTLASARENILVWKVATWQPLRSLQGDGERVLSVAWSPDGKTLASASSNHIQLWNAASGQPLRTLQGYERYEGPVNSVAWSPDGKTLASASDDRRVRLWPGNADVLLDQVRDRIRLFTLSKEDCQRYFGSDSCLPVH